MSFAVSEAFVAVLIVSLAHSTAATPASRTLTHVSALALIRSDGFTKSEVIGKLMERVAILIYGTLILMWASCA